MSNSNNSRIRVNIHEDNDQVFYIEQVYLSMDEPFTRYPANYNSNSFNEFIFNGGNQEDEIRSALNRVSMIDVMSGLFGSMYEVSEDRMMEIAQRESLNHYRTQEKKPDVKLDIDCSVATDKLKDEKCTICVTAFEIGEKITELECKHVLHTECIAEWVKYKSECPICRHSVKTIGDCVKSDDEDDLLDENEINIMEVD